MANCWSLLKLCKVRAQRDLLYSYFYIFFKLLVISNTESYPREIRHSLISTGWRKGLSLEMRRWGLQLGLRSNRGPWVICQDDQDDRALQMIYEGEMDGESDKIGCFITLNSTIYLYPSPCGGVIHCSLLRAKTQS